MQGGRVEVRDSANHTLQPVSSHLQNHPVHAFRAKKDHIFRLMEIIAFCHRVHLWLVEVLYSGRRKDGRSGIILSIQGIKAETRVWTPGCSAEPTSSRLWWPHAAMPTRVSVPSESYCTAGLPESPLNENHDSNMHENCASETSSTPDQEAEL